MAHDSADFRIAGNEQHVTVTSLPLFRYMTGPWARDHLHFKPLHGCKFTQAVFRNHLGWARGDSNDAGVIGSERWTPLDLPRPIPLPSVVMSGNLPETKGRPLSGSVQRRFCVGFAAAIASNS